MLQICNQLRMLFDIEPEAAHFHPHGSRDGAHLDFVGGPLHMKTGQYLLSDPPGDDGVDRGVFDLLLG